ncbi:hypothetical protein [Aequorivita sp. CIP111184]|uniref:hypothetical protein n=1 Tax=Aequorivita sp. CIP111184 TaxID=2211356 RepID=UPI0011BF512A|nr:hypothetical protein [Aequorivita sp. CIP111184]
MKRSLLTLIFIFTIAFLHSQSSGKREEIRIQYTNGLEIFNVLVGNNKTDFDDNKEYYWYTEFSKIKSTKGGNGGMLLDGNYKFYDEKGNLIINENYKLGLKQGESKKWNDDGDLMEILKFDEGETVYWKYHPDDDEGWVEQIGRMLNDGWIKNSIDQYGNLLASQKTFSDDKSEVKGLKTKTVIYYKNSTIKKEEYTTFMFLNNSYIGEYTQFYENGNKRVYGKLFDPFDNGINKYAGNIRDGEWKWYLENGELDITDKYRAKIEYWDNGNIKFIYGQLFDEEVNNWINHGVFYSYEENGEGIGDTTEYEWGEIKEK